MRKARLFFGSIVLGLNLSGNDKTVNAVFNMSSVGESILNGSAYGIEYLSTIFLRSLPAAPVETGVERVKVLLVQAVGRYAERLAEISKLKGMRFSARLSKKTGLTEAGIFDRSRFVFRRS